MPEAKVISFINFKGGVGKTASAVNVSAELAYIHGKKVLVIDSDPQANSTVWLIGVERFREMIDEQDLNHKQTMDTLFHGAIFGGRINYDVERSIRHNVCNRDGKRLDNLDLIPAEYSMISLENYLVNANYRELILGKAIKPILHLYDFIIIDCPPNLYTVTKNALLTSDYYIIPTVPDFLSHVGLEILTREIRNFILGATTQKLKLLGIIFTMGKAGVSVYEQGTERITESLSELKSKGIVDPMAKIIGPWIPYYAGVGEAALDNFPLCIHGGPNVKTPRDLYNAMSSNILEELESR